MVDQRGVGLVADGGDQRDVAVGGRADHDLLIETPEVFDGAAAARHDQHVRTRHGTVDRQGIESPDGLGDLLGGLFALDQDRPEQDMAREAVLQAMQDVANDGAGRRGHHTDRLRQEGDGLLAGRVEQALGRELALALFQQGHQGPGPGGLHALDDQLVLRPTRIGGELALDDDFQTLFRAEAETGGRALPGNGGDDGALILDVEIDMAGLGHDHPAQFTANPDMTEGILNRPLERTGQFGDREFVQVSGGLFHAISGRMLPASPQRPGRLAIMAGLG